MNTIAIVKVWGLDKCGGRNVQTWRDLFHTQITSAYEFKESEFQHIQILFPEQSTRSSEIFVEINIRTGIMTREPDDDNDFTARIVKSLKKLTPRRIIVVVHVLNMYYRFSDGSSIIDGKKVSPILELC